MRAVIFDLWNTIAEWPHERWAEVRPRVAEQFGLSPEEFDSRWYGELAQLRETRPFADVLAPFNLSAAAAERVVALRREVTRQGLVPVPGSVETIESSSTVTTPGRINGNATRTKVRSSPAPSMRAASSNSSGTEAAA